MRTVQVVVRRQSDTKVHPVFCRAHPSGSYADTVVSQGVANTAARLMLSDLSCPRCTAEHLAAGRIALCPEAINAKGEPVPVGSLLDGALPVEREFLDTVMAAADAAGAADTAALLRGLRRALARPESAEASELRAALLELLGPCCTPGSGAVLDGEFRKTSPRWRKAA